MIVITIESNQYHFIDPDGWTEEWITHSAREWWKKHLWLAAGGHNQEESECKSSRSEYKTTQTETNTE